MVKLINLKISSNHTMMSIKRISTTFLYVLCGRKNDVLIKKISVPSTITLEKPHLFQPNMIYLQIVIRVSPLDLLDTFDRNINIEDDEINIKFIFDLKDMTFSHYMAQPKSMLCRKLIRKFVEEDFG